MTFRIAIGSASCKDEKFCKKKYVRIVCKGIKARLQKIRVLSIEELSSIEDGQSEYEAINHKSIQYTYYKKPSKNGTLFVVQGFVSTLNWPTYISLNAIGHIAAEGVIINKKGQAQEAQDNDLWHYR